ncbi:MAG: patatin-like phospholipase family protein [Bacteroidales bacterium]|nr:patatin-like phospholipase family protein [Bacteroidales bacterium]
MNKRKYVKARYWNSDKDFEFPEQSYLNETTKENTGLAISGGGTRSMSLTLGYLRQLNSLGYLDKVKYLSSVSGGSWASVPFIFLDHQIDDADFFGKYYKPEDISEDVLKYDPEYSLARAISRSYLMDDLIRNVFAGDELYSRIIGSLFLKPFNIGSNRKFFTYNESSLQEILNLNPDLNEEDFYLVNKKQNRPYLIAGGTILRSDFGRFQFEMSPLYTGVYNTFPKEGANDKLTIGGGYIQPFGFDTDSPMSVDDHDTNARMVSVRIKRRQNIFALSDVVGTSGAAPAEYLERFGLGYIGFPEFKYWSPVDLENKIARAKEYDFGDGGILENLGIMPLLIRKVDRIICFINGSTPLKNEDGELQISSSLPALFKQIPNSFGEGHFDKNIVFRNDKGQLDKLQKGLLKNVKDGKPAVYTGEYKTVDQEHYNIKARHKVKITWVYNSLPGQWKNSLPLGIRRRLSDGDYSPRFPYFKTFFENFPKIIDLNLQQVNLASQLTSWTIDQVKDQLG